MPVAETVTIHVNIDTDPARSQAKIESLFRQMETRAKMAEKKLDLYEKKMGDIDRTSNKAARSIKKTEKAFRVLSRTLKQVGSAVGKFLAMFTKFSFIGVAIEIALVSAALLGVKLALVSGRLAIKAYQASLTGLGIAAQGVAVVLGSVAAAMRQINEVTLSPDVGGTKAAAQVLRSTMNDQLLSFYGMEGVKTAVTALAKGGLSPDAGYTQILRKLGDYTADPKELADLASIYATVSKSGTIDSASLEGFAQVNPALASGIEEISGLSGDQLKEVLGEEGTGLGIDVLNAVLAGQAEATNAWEGQLSRLNNTVVGTLKGMIPRMFQLFADLGAPFLDTIQQMLGKIEQIIENTVMRIRGSVTSFGLDSLLPGILSGFEKLADLFVRITNSAGTMDGWMETIGGWWDTIRNYFIDMQRIFESLEPAADALIDILGPQWSAIWEGASNLIRNFGDLLIENKDDFMAFSEALGRVWTAVFGLFDRGNELFADAAPIWTNFADMVADDLVPLLGDIFDMLHKASQTILPAVTSAFSALAGALSGVARALTQIMNIPMIGVLLSAMMFKPTRALALGGLGLAGKGLSKAPGMAGGALGLRTTFGSLAAGHGVMGLGTLGSAAAPISMASLAGITAAPAVAGGISGTMLGRMAGANFEGTKGKAMGAGSGALVGGGAGALIGTAVLPVVGTAVGAAIGGVVGGITGWFGAQGAQQAKDAGEEAGEALTEAYLTSLQRGLEKGQGMAAFTGIVDQYKEDTNRLVAAAESDAEATAIRIQRLNGLLDLQNELNPMLSTYHDRLGLLKTATGLATDEIEHLANIMGVNLHDATMKLLDAAIAMGVISEYDISVEGIRDNTNKLLNENLWGQGSVFEKEFLAPEKQDTLNALLNEANDTLRSGGALTSDDVKDIVTNLISVGQMEGMEGTDLVSAVSTDLARIDELLGSGTTFTQLIPDVQKTLLDWNDPTKNPALQALKLAKMDEIRYEDRDNQLTPKQITDLATARYDETMDAINQLPIQNRDEALAVAISESRMASSIQAQETLDSATVELATKFGYLGDQIDWIIAGGEGPMPASPKDNTRPSAVDSEGRSGFGSRTTPTPAGPRGTRSGRATPSVVASTTTSNTTVTASSSSSSTVNMNVTGLGLREAMVLMRAEAQKAARNIAQRRAGANSGRNIFRDYG